MQIVAVASDIVECLRIGRLIERHGERFLERLFTPREIRSCQRRRHAIQLFAARWAAKEAIVRWLGVSRRGSLSWTDMEIRLDGEGRPRVHLGGAAKERAQHLELAEVHVSLAHCRAYATAHAIAVRNP